MLQIIIFLALTLGSLISRSTVSAADRIITGIADTYINFEEFNTNSSHGEEPILLLQRKTVNGFTSTTYAYIHFSTDPFRLMSSEYIKKAELNLNLIEASENTCKISVERAKAFSEYDTAKTLPFTSFSPTYHTVSVAGTGNYSFDITLLVKDWIQNKFEDLAVVLYASDADCVKKFASLNYQDYTKKPIIKVETAIAPTNTPFPSPTNTPKPAVVLKTPTPKPRDPTITLVPTATPTPVVQNIYPTPTDVVGYMISDDNEKSKPDNTDIKKYFLAFFLTTLAGSFPVGWYFWKQKNRESTVPDNTGIEQSSDLKKPEN